MTVNNLIQIYNEAGWLCPIPARKLKTIINAMLKVVPNSLGHIALYVVRDGEIMQLNNEHLSCHGPTNVLSFPSELLTAGQENPHTIVISVDTLKRECLLYGQDIVEHFLRLLAHGLGHVAGYDHGDEMFSLCEQMEDVGFDLIK